jgi:hypothetical protein
VSNFNADIPGPGLARIPGPEAKTDSKPGLFDCSRGIQRQDKTRRWSKRNSNPWSLPARAPPLFADEKGRRSIRMVVNGTRSSGGCTSPKIRFALDSPLEGSGFEPSVPLPRLSSIRAVRAEIIGRSTDVFRRDQEFDVSALQGGLSTSSQSQCSTDPGLIAGRAGMLALKFVLNLQRPIGFRRCEGWH